MFSLNDCLTDSTKILILKKKESKLFKSKIGKIYRKHFNPAEFVGEELSDMKNIPTARYTLIGETIGFTPEHYDRVGEINKRMFDFKIGSYDFKKDDCDYISVGEKYFNNEHALDALLELCPTESNKDKLMDELEELYALDTYMGQTDRKSQNIIFSINKKTKEIHLAPIFDYEYSLNPSYLDSDIVYENAFLRFDSIESYQDYLRKHPALRDKLKFYLDVDLCDTVRRSYGSRCMIIPRNMYSFYKEFDEDRKELIKKIIR